MQSRVEGTPPGSPLRAWPWVGASVLLLTAGVAAARATYLFWLPCHGSMTRGLSFLPDSSDAPIPDACLQQMDSGTPFPYATAEALAGYAAAGPKLAAAAMVLTGLAWLVLVLGLRWRLRTTIVAVVPALLSIGLGLSSARAAVLAGARPAEYATTPWWLMLEISAVGVLIAIRLWQPELSDWEVARLALVLWGATAFGHSHFILDYLTMTTLHRWNWDAPPGCGYPTVVAIVVAMALTAHGAGLARARPLVPDTRSTAPQPRP